MRLKPTEPPFGLGLRLACRLKLQSSLRLAANLGLTATDMLNGRGSKRLCNAAGFSEDKWPGGELAPDVKTRTVWVRGHALLLDDWCPTFRRWCPACLLDDRTRALQNGEPIESAAWWRPEWAVRSYLNCSHHACALIERCYGCSAPQRWHGPAVDRCHCGAILATDETIPASVASWETFVSDRLAGDESRALLGCDPLRELLPAVERLGTSLLQPWSLSRPRADDVTRATAREAAMTAISNWPASFRRRLDEVAAGTGTDLRPRGLIGAYGWIHSEWATFPPRTELDRQVRREVREHAIQSGFVAAGEPLYDFRGGGTIHMTTAAGRLAIGYKRARQLVADAGALPSGTRRGVAFPLDPVQIEEIASQEKRTICFSLKHEQADLGVGRQQARRLRATFGSTGPGWVLRLIESCAAGCSTSVLVSGARPLPNACQAVGVPLELACAALIKGEIKACSVDPDRAGLGGIAVQTSDLRALSTRPVSIERAARRLGIHHEAVRWLVRHHHLRRHEVVGITPGAIDAFAATFATATELARDAQMSTRALSSYLEARGCRPAFGPPSCRQVIYWREGASRALSGAQ
ncbi:TniQ family protein [Sphingomonas xinjiangensis]|uniref:TniQ family protein n=1 Tax=Sphingomonas xinjiangensis TaxID=643568 RepID=UPI003CCD4C6C